MLPICLFLAAHSMPSTFLIKTSHRQGDTADPPFTVVCWGAASAGAWKPIARRRRIFGWPSPLGVRLYGSLSQAAESLFLSAGLENVLRMSPTRSLLHLLGRGAGPVIRRVWTLTCDCETRRPRPRRDGAKLTGAGAPHRSPHCWRSGICGSRRRILVRLCKTGFKAQPGQNQFLRVLTSLESASTGV